MKNLTHTRKQCKSLRPPRLGQPIVNQKEKNDCNSCCSACFQCSALIPILMLTLLGNSCRYIENAASFSRTYLTGVHVYWESQLAVQYPTNIPLLLCFTCFFIFLIEIFFLSSWELIYKFACIFAPQMPHQNGRKFIWHWIFKIQFQPNIMLLLCIGLIQPNIRRLTVLKYRARNQYSTGWLLEKPED